MRNHGLKVLGLALLSALGMMAFAVAGAQAQTHEHLLKLHAEHNAPKGPLNPESLAGGTLGKFSVNLGPIVEVDEKTKEVIKTLKVPVTAAQNGTGVLLVAGRSIEIRCTELTLNSGEINSNTDASGEATFSGCETFDHKTLNKLETCILKTLGTITAKALVLPVLHGGENFLLFEPQNAGEAFATPSYKPGIGCTLPLNNPVTGSVYALVEQLEGASLGVLFSSGIQLLLGGSLAFGGFPSYITAEGSVSPTSAGHTKIGVH